MSSAREVHRIYTGFTMAWIGEFEFDVTDDGSSNSYTITITTGRYYHALDDTADTRGKHESFRAKLQTELNGASGSPGDWTVEWQNANQSYRIFRTGTPTFTATLNDVAQEVLGMSASLNTGTASSSKWPNFVREPDDPYLGQAQGNREPQQVGEQYVTDGGDLFGIMPTKRPKRDRWVMRGEPDTNTHIHAAASDASEPWTWEHLFEHCLAYSEPLVLVDTDASINSDGDITWDSTDVVMRCKLQNTFMPDETIPNRHTKWDVPMRVMVTKRF